LQLELGYLGVSVPAGWEYFFLPTNMRKWWNLPNTLQFDTQMEGTGCTAKLTGQLCKHWDQVSFCFVFQLFCINFAVN
jgi:hypothetical protein